MTRYDTSCGPMSCIPTRKDDIPEFLIKALYCRAVCSIYGQVNNSCSFTVQWSTFCSVCNYSECHSTWLTFLPYLARFENASNITNMHVFFSFFVCIYVCSSTGVYIACARVTVLVLSVCLCVCVFSLFWHLAQSGVQTAVSATSARYGHEI